MKKSMVVLVALMVLLAAPVFADGETESDITVNIDVKPYAELTFPEGSTITMNTNQSEANSFLGSASDPGDRYWLNFDVLANFDYDLELSAEAFLGTDGEPLDLPADQTDEGWPAAALKANNGGPNNDQYLAYFVRLETFGGGPSADPSTWRTIRGDKTERVMTIEGGTPGETATNYRLYAFFRTLGNVGSPSEWASGDTAFLEGEYDGELTLTVVAQD